MSNDFSNRQTIRLQQYDYSGNGFYFVTICTANRENLFGNIVNGQMVLNDAGKIAKDEWLKTPKIRHEIKLHDFVIMPNHFHAIIEITVANGGSPVYCGGSPERGE